MFRLQLITLKGHHVDEDVFELRVPTTAGPIAINEGHAPLLAAVAPGVLSIRRRRDEPAGEIEQLGVYDGTVEVLNNTVRVLVDELDTPDTVIWADAEEAQKRAIRLKETAKDSVSISEAQAMIDRQAVRLQLADLKKKSSKKRY